MSQTPHTASPSPETNGALAKVTVAPPAVAAGHSGLELSPDTVDQPVIYERTIFWSRFFVWFIVGITAGSVAWAYFSKIDEAVPAVGRLETKEPVREIQTPTAGVILDLKVKDGDKVAAGDLLLTLDPTGPKADRTTLLQTKAALETENSFYQSYLEDFQVPLISGDNVSDEFVQNLQRSLESSASDFRSRVSAADLEVTQLESQGERIRQQIEGNQRLILANANILGRTQAILETNRKILEDMRPVSESGALSLLQFRQQEQRVQSAEADKLSREGELVRLESEINQLRQEEQRIVSAISQGKERKENVISQFRREILQRITENQKRLTDISGQLEKAEKSLEYQEVRAPIAGTVFDLRVSAGGVISGVNAANPVMKLVPKDSLEARVFITDRDIGFVRKKLNENGDQGVPVEVNIDSFPKLQYGGVNGTLIAIGSDALPPDPQTGRQFFAFPARIRLDTQALKVGNACQNEQDRGECIELPLQPGMAVSTSILTRKRRVLDIFLSQFVDRVDSLREVR